MDLNALTRQIELELHNDKKISPNTRQTISNLVSKYKVLRGGAGFAQRAVEMARLSGLDKALIGTINKQLPQLKSDIKTAVLNNIAATGQQLFPDNANIYLTNVATDASELKSKVNETIKHVQAIRGGQVNDLVVRIMAAITLMVLIVAVYCTFEYVSRTRTQTPPSDA